ncbi:NAD(P)H-dependent oxidoreductase [Candidatus Dojkabacteria bacterium]|nr:NAD(P)H-dependent oxidoreductase [Candidatus Dojkabacteria bacterium]
MKKVLIINGHPNKSSFNFGVAKAYREGAKQAKAEIKEIVIAKLKFNPNLHFGYQKRTKLEPDLLTAWEKIKWADHLVWVHPVWWGGFPAIMKGFIDRLFLPGFTYKFRKNSIWWDGLLKGKTARIITTLDQPRFFYLFAFGQPSINQLKRSILEFCGVRPIKITCIESMKHLNREGRKKCLEKIQALGKKLQ